MTDAELDARDKADGGGYCLFRKCSYSGSSWLVDRDITI